MRPPDRNEAWLWSTNASVSPFSSADAARPASDSARSGTMACASPPAVAVSSRTASRYESVATTTTPSRFTSRRTPVSVGRASSRDAARPTCETASANDRDATWTRIPEGSCHAGKSSAGRSRKVPSNEAHLIRAWVPSASNSTGASGRLFTMSPNRRAGTSDTPASEICTSSMARRAETSRSVVVRTRAPASSAWISTPVSAGIPGLVETPR